MHQSHQLYLSDEDRAYLHLCLYYRRIAGHHDVDDQAALHSLKRCFVSHGSLQNMFQYIAILQTIWRERVRQVRFKEHIGQDVYVSNRDHHTHAFEKSHPLIRSVRSVRDVGCRKHIDVLSLRWQIAAITTSMR